MKTIFKFGLIGLVGLLVAGFVILRYFPPTPDLTETYREVDGNHERRWIWNGGDPVKMQATFDAIKNATGERVVPEQWDTVAAYGPGHWIYEFIQLGDAEVQRAEQAQIDGDEQAAKNGFLEASSYYVIAKFPHLRNRDAEHYDEAYRKSLRAYEAAGAYFEVPLEVIEIPFGSGTLRGYLHLADDALAGPAPLVIASGGVDVFKDEFYPVVRLFNAEGISVLVADLPGTGETNFVDTTFEHDQIYSEFLDYLRGDDRIEIDRVGVFATSWGGNAAARVAFRDRRFKAVVSACGPIHETLAVPLWAVRLFPKRARMAAPPLRIDVSADRFGLELPLQQRDILDFAEQMRSFSLRHQGLVGQGAKPTSPLLIINANDDPFSPPEDMEALGAASDNAEIIYIGPGGHCGDRDDLLGISIPWMKEKLSEES